MIKRFSITLVVLSLVYLGMCAAFERDSFLARYEWKFHPGKEDGAIKEAVVLYNKIFTGLYASDGVPTMLNEFPASTQLRHEVFRNIGFLREQGFILVYDMADLIFMDIKRPSPVEAEVTVFEEWNYLFQKTATREPTHPVKGMGKGFRYLLVKLDRGWTVVDYFPSDVKVEKKDEFLY